ncbi:MAG: LacI family transcriptional regulator [Chloroflexi bacterium]|nr:LacI family transcriptional regulator [Chloroflexota bacterium]MCI0581239.1 LacI family transcriptional regulator [Chloroflexota bacterium]MCI0646916.1 LacI family transcriptional regulator [Chloroflexota bacterium]MCI0731645.1 LacI family transcriptional regulator [Chloroflexota bacterium]
MQKENIPEENIPVRANINDVARRAGVSIATVSRVVNKTGPVAAGTAQRVHTAIAELSYAPHAAARGLASRKTHILGLLFPEISGAFFSALLRGIESYVTENGYGLLIYSTQGRAGDENNGSLPLGKHNTDGLIIFTDSLSEMEVLRLYAHRFPMVLLHRSPPQGVTIPCITFENKGGAYQAVKHLIAVHGYRRIMYLAGLEGNEDSYWREMGYRQALEEAGLPYDPTLVASGRFNDKVAEEVIAQHLSDGLTFDAIFAADDESARGAIAALRRAGRRVPEDVAVAGFDDALLSRHLDPPLTTVRAPIEQAGRKAAEELLCLIRTGQAESLVLLPTELVIRRSCGCWLGEIEK